MAPQKKIFHFLAIALFAIFIIDDVSAEAQVEEINLTSAAKNPDAEPSSGIYSIPSELETLGCECNEKPEAQDLGEKDGPSKIKKSGKKFRVITISIPVEPESLNSEGVVVKDEVADEGDKLDSVSTTKAAPALMEKEKEKAEEEVEETVIVPEPKKQSSKGTKSDKKRSKRSTKEKQLKDKEFSKTKGEKKTNKGTSKK